MAQLLTKMEKLISLR